MFHVTSPKQQAEQRKFIREMGLEHALDGRRFTRIRCEARRSGCRGDVPYGRPAALTNHSTRYGIGTSEMQVVSSFWLNDQRA